MPEWITDRKPDDDRDVLITKSNHLMTIGYWEGGGWWRFQDGTYHLETEVLAWMLLPEAYDERMEA